MSHKFNFVERERIRTAIKTLHDAGVTGHQQVTDELIKLGYKGPGGKPLQVGTVQSQAYEMRKKSPGFARTHKAKVPSATQVVVAREDELRALRHLVLTCSVLSAEKKIRVMELID